MGMVCSTGGAHLSDLFTKAQNGERGVFEETTDWVFVQTEDGSQKLRKSLEGCYLLLF